MASPTLTTAAALLLVFLVTMSYRVTCNYVPVEHMSHYYDPYSFGYDVEDHYGNKQWRQEKSHNPQEVTGSYGYRDKNGIYREVVYIADKHGFRANIKTNEPGMAESKDPADVKVDSHAHAPSVYHRQMTAASVPVYYSSVVRA